MSDRFLSGQVALITGGATGICRATALAMASAGADIVIGSLTEAARLPIVDREGHTVVTDEDLEKARKEISDAGVQVQAHALNVAVNESCDAIVEATIQEFGKVDILVNGAGSSLSMSMVNHDDEAWHRVIDVNLNGAYRMIKRALPGMMERKSGRIINIASTAASIGEKTRAAYCASKSAILGLTRAVALEGAPNAVTCNAISPGGVVTQQAINAVTLELEMKGIKTPVEEFFDATAAEKPQKRHVESREIAALALFLCRADALSITGQDLTVDGGNLW